MAKAAQLVGTRFGRLLVTGRAENSPTGQTRWHCVCDCGNTSTVMALSLKSGASKSCGCFMRESVSERRFKHGGTGTPEYWAWNAMWQRCTNSKDKMFYRYGKRGITVCERWREFANFYADMGSRPSASHTLERKDNDRDYEPSNCVWDTRKAQSRNRNSNYYVVYQGHRVPLSVAIEMAGSELAYKTVRRRVKAGWPLEKALKHPADTRGWNKRRAK